MGELTSGQEGETNSIAGRYGKISDPNSIDAVRYNAKTANTLMLKTWAELNAAVKR
jgi:hypothetical protein